MSERALSGGDKLTAKLAEISKQLEKAAQVKVGFLEGSTESLTGTSSAAAATFQEWGTVNTKSHTVIPPRPFFRPMIAEKSGEWGDQLAKVLKFNNYDTDQSLSQMGMLIGSELQESIIAVSEPALSPITLMLRKMRSEDQSLIVGGKTVAEAARRVAAGESPGDVSTKPLVDTGDMLNSVAYQVDSNEKVEVDPDRAGRT